MSYQAVTIVLALALLLSGVAQQADNDLNEALGIKNTPLLQSHESPGRHSGAFVVSKSELHK